MGRVGGSYQYNVECDVCGFSYKNHELIKRWDGLMVCKSDWEARHPMDFFKPRNDFHQLPFIRAPHESKIAKASLSADVTPTTGAWTHLELDSEDVDTLSEYDPALFVYTSSLTTERKFNFRYVVTQTGGESSLEIALYKNGASIKTIGPLYLYGQGSMSIGGFYVDADCTAADEYKVYYRINTDNGVIESHENSTSLEVT